MKAFLAACIAMVVIAVGSNFVLSNAGFSSKEQTVGNAVRLNP